MPLSRDEIGAKTQDDPGEPDLSPVSSDSRFRTSYTERSFVDIAVRKLRKLDRPTRSVLIALGAILVLLALVGVTLWAMSQRGATGLPSSRADLGLAPIDPGQGNSGPGDPGQGNSGDSGQPRTSAYMTVHVAGAVLRPGVYRLPIPSRVIDAITASGGPVADADLAAVNLAAEVIDASQIFVPRLGEALGGPSGSASAGPATGAKPGTKLNLNTATEKDLDTLPGIGPATAEKIVRHRRDHGRFKSIDDLRNVAGIGEAKLAEIRPLVVI